MNKLSILLLSLLLVGCRPSTTQTDLDIKILNKELIPTSYQEEVFVINDYSELKESISSYDQYFNDEYFETKDVVIILVYSNAEEYRNGIQVESIKYNEKKYDFTFKTQIKDKGTDLALFITPFAFEISKDYQINEENINVIMNRKIG